MTEPATMPVEAHTATAREQAAFRLGITVAIDMALAAADAIERRPDANGVRQQAAIAALQGLGDALEAAFLVERDRVACDIATTTAEPNDTDAVDRS